MATRPKPEPIALSSEDDLQKLIELSHSKFVILDVHQDWCGPTIVIMPYLNQVNQSISFIYLYIYILKQIM